MPTYTTWNPADKSASITLSGSDLVWTAALPSAVRSVAGNNSGKFYFEAAVDVTGGNSACANLGVATAASSLSLPPGNTSTSYGVRLGRFGVADMWIAHGYNVAMASWTNVINLGSNTATLMVAVDIAAGKIWLGYNGTWIDGGDPAAGTGETYSGLTGTFYACAGVDLTTGATGTVNFGASAFTYSVPSGFNAGFWPDVDRSGDITATFPTFRATLVGHDEMLHVDATATLPAFGAVLYATVSSIAPQPGTIISGVLPAIRGAFFGGGEVRLELSKTTFLSTGAIGVSGNLTVPLALTLDIRGFGAISGVLAPTVSKMSLASTGIIGILGYFGKTEKTGKISLSLTSTGLTGITGSLSLPLAIGLNNISAAISPHGDGTFSITFGFSATGTYGTAFRSMVMNLKNRGLTEYLSYNFDSLFEFDGKYFGANSAGIYELTGTQDVSTDIAWRIMTPRIDLETDDVKKSLRYVWLGCKLSGDVTLSVIQPDGTRYDYPVDAVTDVDGGIRVKFGRGIKSRYVDMELSNVSGESLVLDKFRIFTEPTAKKR